MGNKGAGINVGIVVSVTFKAFVAPIYSIRKWVVLVGDRHEARLKLSDFDEFVAGGLPGTGLQMHIYTGTSTSCILA